MLDWSKRFNIYLLAICIVDYWIAYSQVTENRLKRNSEYDSILAEELIDNRFDEGFRGGIMSWIQHEVLGEISQAIINDG